MTSLALSIKNLSKVYANGVVALKNIDLEVAQGDFFALLGQNGAGKSTTIGIICSLVTKSAGDVDIFGYNIDIQSALAKSLIGVVPQEMNFNLFETASSILLHQAGYYGVPYRIAYQRMEMYLKEMGIWNMRDQVAFRLSGGMKRRLMIARALINAPRLLILDEPTAGVDIELRHLLWRFLQKINAEGTTIILTTHYLEEAERLCKNVGIIHHGEIIEHTQMELLLDRLHMQTMLLDLENVLSFLPDTQPFICRLVDERTLEVEIHRGQHINFLFQLLSQHGILVRSVRNKTNRLEELFIHLVSEKAHA